MFEEKNNIGSPQVGSLVRTRRLWGGGIHRAVITSIEGNGCSAVATVSGNRYALSDLEVIRDPIKRREYA